MHILVIGGTGPAGIEFINAALKAGHELTVYARSPKKLSWEVLNNDKVHIVEGTFEDEKAIEKAVDSGAEVIVSCAGPTPGNRGKGTPVTDFYAKVYNLIKSKPDCKIKRCLILSTASHPDPKDGFGFKWFCGVLLISTVVHFMYNEIVCLSKLTAEQPVDRIGWTLYRVPGLTNGAAGEVQEGYIGSGKDGLLLSRKSLANWLVKELKEKKWVGQAPMLSNATWF